MRLDKTDSFIIEHANGMTMQAMADHLGISKSTVSRRAKALRDSGEIEITDTKAVERLAKQERNKLKSCAMDDADRLMKLDALKTMLEEGMAASGGANLARLSSEYRKLIEEMANISTSLELANGGAKHVGMLAKMQIEYTIESDPEIDSIHCDVGKIVDKVLRELHERQIIFYTSEEFD